MSPASSPDDECREFDLRSFSTSLGAAMKDRRWSPDAGRFRLEPYPLLSGGDTAAAGQPLLVALATLTAVIRSEQPTTPTENDRAKWHHDLGDHLEAVGFARPRATATQRTPKWAVSIQSDGMVTLHNPSGQSIPVIPDNDLWWGRVHLPEAWRQAVATGRHVQLLIGPVEPDVMVDPTSVGVADLLDNPGFVGARVPVTTGETADGSGASAR